MRRLTHFFRGRRVTALHGAGGEPALVRLQPQVVGHIYPAHREDSVLVNLDQVPRYFVDALIAVEDRYFWTHHGVSLRGIARAAWANLRAGAAVQGGSTLTQQLAKSLFLTPERSLWRKAREALIALILEARYDKRAILEAYLNEIYLGQQGARAIHGFGLAARFYFGRPLAELDLAESALLIGLARGASLYDPRRHPRRARQRRNRVLAVLRARGLIDERIEQRARSRALGVTPRPAGSMSAHPGFIDLVRRQLRRDYRASDLRSRGLRIFTTLDPRVQRAAEQTLATRVAQLQRGRPGRLQGAVVVTARNSGEVLALVGDRDPRASGFNRALDAVRPIGSLVKPAIYLAALERPARYRLDTPLEDRPVTIRSTGGQPWKPRNYDGRAHGRVPLYRALAHSYNLATVRLGLALGTATVADTLRDLGVARPVPRYPSMLLGAVDLAPIEAAGVYQTIASGGFRMPLRATRALPDARGAVSARDALPPQRAFPARGTARLNAALQAVMNEGTGRAAYRTLPAGLALAGKTGTTDGRRDSWFAGFDGERLAVVWLGRDDNGPAQLSGASGALRVWIDLMNTLGAVASRRYGPWHQARPASAPEAG